MSVVWVKKNVMQRRKAVRRTRGMGGKSEEEELAGVVGRRGED